MRRAVQLRGSTGTAPKDAARPVSLFSAITIQLFTGGAQTFGDKCNLRARSMQYRIAST
jgi:hypothetical protein